MPYGGHRTVTQQGTLYQALDMESWGNTGWPSKSQVHGGLLKPQWEALMQIFLPEVLRWALAKPSSVPSFPMVPGSGMECIQPWPTPFPSWNLSVVPCSVLTVASWSAYRFLRRQVRWSGIPISWRIPQFVVIHTVKGFGIVNKAEIDVFLELSCFINDPAIWSLVPLSFLNPACTSGSSRFTYC